MAKRTSGIISAALVIIFIFSTFSACAKMAASSKASYFSFLDISGITVESITALQKVGGLAAIWEGTSV